MYLPLRMQKRNRFAAGCLVLALAMLVFWGCGSGGGGESGGSSVILTPEIALGSSSIAFGNVVINPAQAEQRSVTVQNTGTGNLTIGTIALTPSGSPFSIVSGKDTCSSQALAPSASCSVVVSFLPTAQGSFTGSLTIPSDDADESSLPVALAGAGKSLNVVINNVDLNCPTATPATVTVTVTDSANTPNTTLVESDFTPLAGAGFSTPVPILGGSFGNTTTAPVCVALALDFSNSLVDSFDQIRITAGDFIDTLTDTDKANVYKFAEKIDSADAASPFLFTTVLNKPVLKEEVDRANDLTGTPTYLFDALDSIIGWTGLESIKRRAIILVTDGFDDTSFASIDDVIASAKSQGVFIFSIGLGAAVDAVTLQRLATETGGQYFYAPTKNVLTSIYTQISSILSNQYQFQFANPVQGSSLRVAVVDGVLEGENTVTLPSCP
jgi:hypothetical protein